MKFALAALAVALLVTSHSRACDRVFAQLGCSQPTIQIQQSPTVDLGTLLAALQATQTVQVQSAPVVQLQSAPVLQLQSAPVLQFAPSPIVVQQAPVFVKSRPSTIFFENRRFGLFGLRSQTTIVNGNGGFTSIRRGPLGRVRSFVQVR